MNQWDRLALQNDMKRPFHPETGRDPLWIEERRDAVFMNYRYVSSVGQIPFAYQEVMMNHWDELAFEYDPKSPFKRVWSRTNTWVEMFERALDGCHRVLDVGCGAGFLAVPLAEKFEVHGIDLSEEMLNLAAKRARESNLKLELTYGDSHTLPFEDNFFDATYCKFALWPLKNPERALKEMVRVVRSGGRIVIIEVDRKKKYEGHKMSFRSKVFGSVEFRRPGQ